jgi:hypothetical protein
MHVDEHTQQGLRGIAIKRRGILAAAGAVVAGIVAKQGSQPIAAVNGGMDGGPLVLGANDIFGASPLGRNTAANPTQLTNTSGTVTASPTSFFHRGAGLIVTASDGAEGIMGFANGPFGVGVWGVSNRGRAVYGELTGSGAGDGGKAVSGDALGNTNAYGVHGAASSASSTGVYGLGSQGIGVQGESTSGIGVQGTISSPSSTASTIAVQGLVSGSGAGTYAVQGFNQSSGPGGYGVQGLSLRSHGVYGEAGSDQGSGALVGVTRANTGVAFQAVALAPATFAGYFQGNVSVFGSLGVTGGKFAVVKSADGTYRAMHAVEAPDAWFEDMGTAQLVNGAATVTLDPLFAEHVRTEAYHVFLTAEADSNGLYVAERTGRGFTVKEQRGGSTSMTFSWRLVAKRADVKGERLPVWELPPAPKYPLRQRRRAGGRRGRPNRRARRRCSPCRPSARRSPWDRHRGARLVA